MQMNNLFKGIKIRLIVIYVLLIIISFMILGIAIYFSFERYYLRHVEQSLLAEANLIKELLGTEVFFEPENLDNHIEKAARDVNTRITIIDNTGNVLGDSHEAAESMDNHRLRPEFKAVFQDSETGISRRFSSTVEHDMLYLAVPVETEGAIIGAVRVSLSLEQIDEALDTIAYTIGLIILIMIGATAIVSIKVSQSVTKPIEELDKTAREIASGNLSRKSFVSADDEIGRLSNSLNYMTEKLQQKIEELEISKGKLETIMNSLSMGIMVLDPLGKIEMLTPQAEKYLGIKDKNIAGKQYFRIIRNYKLSTGIENALKNKKHIEEEIFITYPQEKTLKVDLIPVITKNKMTALIIVIHDITDIKLLNQMKTQFVANASHELRTPLTSIKGFSETLLSGAVEDPHTREKFIKIIDAEADRLIRTTDGLLDLTRAESEKLVLEKEIISLNEVILDSADRIAPNLREKNLELLLDIPDKIPYIAANKDALARILLNLLDNAIKYTRPGDKVGIKVDVKKDRVRISVWDTGIGIPQEDLPRIFDRFYRVDKSRARDLGGTGLGLAIVKHLVEAHGGSVGVESILEEGSTFWFDLLF